MSRNYETALKLILIIVIAVLTLSSTHLKASKDTLPPTVDNVPVQDLIKAIEYKAYTEKLIDSLTVNIEKKEALYKNALESQNQIILNIEKNALLLEEKQKDCLAKLKLNEQYWNELNLEYNEVKRRNEKLKKRNKGLWYALGITAGALVGTSIYISIRR